MEIMTPSRPKKAKKLGMKDRMSDFLLQNSTQEFTVDEIISQLGIRRSEFNTVQKMLKALRGKGKVALTDGKYRILEVKNDTAETKAKKVNSNHSNSKNGDINYHKYNPLVAVFDAENQLFLPIHRDLRGTAIKAIAGNTSSKLLEDGNVVWVDLRINGSNKVEHGIFKEKIADELAYNETDVHIAAYGIEDKFSPEVIAEVENMKDFDSSTDMQGLVDLRDKPFCTIDGADARDFDDAIHVEQTEDGYVIDVAIAHVTRYVRPGMAVDETAKKRAFSMYFHDRVIPMLPERLSNDLCSLVPNQDRPVVVTQVRINKQGEILSYKQFEGIIHSNARLTYDQVQQAIDGDFTGKISQEFYSKAIEPAYNAFKALCIDVANRGAMELEQTERRIFSEGKKIVEIVNKKRSESHRIIEYFMILANRVSAHSVQSKTGIYRVHEAPSQAKVTDMVSTLTGYGVEIPPEFSNPEKLQPADFRKLIDNVDEAVEDDLIRDDLVNDIIMSQQKAKYSANNIGHFGLAILPNSNTQYVGYSHDTSPIRREPDKILHEIILNNAYQDKDGYDRLVAAAEYCTEREIFCERIPQEVSKRVLIRNYLDKIGETLDATVTKVTAYKVVVTDRQTGAEFNIPHEDLKSLGYTYDPYTRRMVSVSSNTQPDFALGTKLVAKVEKVDILGISMKASFVNFV